MTPTPGSIVEVIPPLLTPLTPAGELDEDSLKSLAGSMLGAGCTGLWVNGTTGEFFATSRELRARAIAVAVEAAGGRDVIGQVGDTSVDRALEFARDAAAAGATALAAITPYYLAHDEPELELYYRAVAGATDLSVMGYHLPGFTKITLAPSFVARLHAEGVLDGYKESSEDIGYLRRLVDARAASGSYYRIYIGGGKLLDASLLSGADGSMSAIANLIPRTILTVVSAYQRGDLETLRAAQQDVWIVSNAMLLPNRPSWGTMVLSMKACLKMLGTIATDLCTPLLRPLTDAERGLLRDNALPAIAAAEQRWASTPKN
jgi:4-hydroxy-tetrahydrodipicolinate synthase